MTLEEAITILREHTQYFIPVSDLGALEMVIEAAQEKVESEE